MIRLTQLAVSKRSVTVLITLGLLLGGLFSWSQLKQELLPDIQFPFVVVITPMPGASAQDVATQVTEPIERSIGSVPRLEHIDSSSVNSLSIVVASFAYGTDVKATEATIDANVKALGLGVSADGPIVRHQRLAAAHRGDQGHGLHDARSAQRPGRLLDRAVARRASTASARST